MSYNPQRSQQWPAQDSSQVYDPNKGLDQVCVSDAKRWLLKKQNHELRCLVHADFQAYVIFLFFVLMSVFYFNNIPGAWDLQNMFVDVYITPPFDANTYPCQNFYDIKNVADFWSWLKNPMLTNNFADCSNDSCKVNEINDVQGSIMMRQKRVSKASGDCEQRPIDCYGFLEADNEDKTAFTIDGTTYEYVENTHSIAVYGLLPLGSARTQEYGNGGFVKYFSESDSTSWATTLSSMQSGDWVDVSTRAVIFEINLYNAGYNRFVHGEILVEFAPSGAIYSSNRVTVLDVKLDQQSDWTFRIVCWVGILACLWFYTIKMIQTIITFVVWESRLYDLQGRIDRSLSEGFNEQKTSCWRRILRVTIGVVFDLGCWGWLEVCLIVVWIGTAAVSCYSFGILNSQESDLDSTTNMLSLNRPAYWHKMSNYMYGAAIFLTIFKATRFCYVSQRLALLCHSINQALADLIAFMVLFFLIFIAFATSGHILFGADSDFYCTFLSTMSAQIGMLYGNVNVNELERLNKYMGPLYYYMFLALVSLILMNTFVGIITASILDVRRRTAPRDRGTDLEALVAKKFSRAKKKLQASPGINLKYVFSIFKYAVCGVYQPDPPELGPLLAFVVPVLVQIIDICETRTRRTDQFCDVTLARRDFVKLMHDVLTQTQFRAAKTIISHDSYLDISEQAWKDMIEWVQQEKLNDTGTFDPETVSEYDMMAHMHKNLKGLHTRMRAEMSVLRSSQREVLRATHSIENQVTFSVSVEADQSWQVTASSDREEDRSMVARYQAYMELFSALDDETFAHEERHLDQHHLKLIMEQFHTVVKGSSEGAGSNGLDTDIEMSSSKVDDSATAKSLSLRVSEIKLESMSTLPLFRDNIFCQVAIGQHVQGSAGFSNGATNVKRTDSVRSTTNHPNVQIDNFSVLNEKEHVFYPNTRALTFQLQDVRFVNAEFVIYHEVPGIRTIEICRGSLNRINLFNERMATGTVKLYRSGMCNLNSDNGSANGTVTYETSWKEEEMTNSLSQMDSKAE